MYSLPKPSLDLDAMPVLPKKPIPDPLEPIPKPVIPNPTPKPVLPPLKPIIPPLKPIVPPPKPKRYRCPMPLEGKCVEDPNGPFTSLKACKKYCKPALPPKPMSYECDRDLGKCHARNDNAGTYATMGACLERCGRRRRPHPHPHPRPYPVPVPVPYPQPIPVPSPSQPEPEPQADPTHLTKKYTCTNQYTCVENLNGAFTSKQSCKDHCSAPPKKGLSKGAIIGISVGSAVFVLLIIIIAVIASKKSNTPQSLQ